MVPFVATAREHHRVRSAAEYLQKHAEFLARQANSGARYVVHESAERLIAWISGNTWVVQCECGSGNATDPGWCLACCYSCGAIHRQIVFPPDVAAVERELVKRRRPANRHWFPHETVDDLRAENITAGIETA